ncbi:hypothetical protein P691DRAFT_784873 [Macrolepiota fuliginosa MF-IS2]|uniref:Uncharacterized protein n=1 Tax=Macrolepiota fuliginosa MF-IS2 TaxID=1400762 RepID=A0A9P5WY07_9AGAR|nr:hypothetical protein P691DRAFT_784873 [Macrolepiota fuliginosa MF-IS2]
METSFKNLKFTELELNYISLLVSLFSACYGGEGSNKSRVIFKLDSVVFYTHYMGTNLYYTQGLTVIMEVKNKVGKGSHDLAAQVVYYYVHIFASTKISDNIKNTSPQPSLLITITGSHLAVYEAIFLNPLSANTLQLHLWLTQLEFQEYGKITLMYLNV